MEVIPSAADNKPDGLEEREGHAQSVSDKKRPRALALREHMEVAKQRQRKIKELPSIPKKSSVQDTTGWERDGGILTMRSKAIPAKLLGDADKLLQQENGMDGSDMEENMPLSQLQQRDPDKVGSD